MDISIGIYDCVANPEYRSAQGNLGVNNAFELNWNKYFDKIKKHPSGLFLMINAKECGILIHNNGNYTITKAENDDIIYKYLDIIKEVVKDGNKLL